MCSHFICLFYSRKTVQIIYSSLNPSVKLFQKLLIRCVTKKARHLFLLFLLTYLINYLCCDLYFQFYIAYIFIVIFTLFTCVPLSTVIPLYCLHLITAPSTVEKCKHWFTVHCEKIDLMPNIYIIFYNISSNRILLGFVSSIFCITFIKFF